MDSLPVPLPELLTLVDPLSTTILRKSPRNGSITETGRVLGTPQYMAPGQAAGRRGEIGPATDVYGLGAILYECLTGRPPFGSIGGVHTVMQVISREPVAPRRLDPRLPADLATICLKCLEKEPRRRYASAHDLAEDLKRFREGRPVHARPVGLMERGWKWARRRPVIAALVLGLCLVTVAGIAGVTGALVYALHGWREAAQQREAAESARAEEARHRGRAEQARDLAEINVAFGRLTQARLEWRANNLAVSTQTLASIEPRRRGWEWRYLKGLHHTDLLTVPNAHEAVATSIAFSPDGRQLASAGGNPYAQPATGTVRVWDAWTGSARLTLSGLHHLATSVAYRPDGRRLAANCLDGLTRIWDPRTGALLGVLPPGPRASPSFPATVGLAEGLAWSPDGRFLVVASRKSPAVVWDAQTGRVVRVLAGAELRVAWSPDGRHIATAGAQTRIWNAADGALVRTLPDGSGPLAFSPDGQLLAVAVDTVIRVHEVGTGRVVCTLSGHDGRVAGVAVSPDGRLLASCGADSTVRLWGVRDGSQRVVWRGHTGRVEALAFHPEGRMLASVGAQPADLKVWDITRHPEFVLVTPPRDDIWVDALGFDAAGRIQLLRRGGRLEVRDPLSAAVLRRHELNTTGAWRTPGSLGAFAAGRLAAIQKDAEQVGVWDVRSGRPAGAGREYTVPVWEVALSGDGRRVAAHARGPHEEVYVSEWSVWEANTGRVLAHRTALDSEAGGRLALSPDGRSLAESAIRFSRNQTGGAPRYQRRDAVLRLWSLPVSRGRGPLGEASAPDWTVTQLREQFEALAFSVDGKRLACATTGGGVQVLDAATGKSIHPRPLAGPPGVLGLAFSPDGQRLAAVTREQVKVWEVSRAQEVLTLRGAVRRPSDGGFTPCVAWSPDGLRLAASNWNHSVSVWESADLSAPPARAALRLSFERRAARWHLEQALSCMAEHDAAGLSFHRKFLDPASDLDPDLSLRRGALYARLGLWQQAAADYRRARRRSPSWSAQSWRQYATLCACAGDLAEYRRACAVAVKAFGATANAEQAGDLAMACVQAPLALPELAEVAALARRGAGGPAPAAWQIQARALAAWRAGDRDGAIHWSHQALRVDQGWGGRGHAWLTLALAHRARGDVQEARRWRQQVERWYAEQTQADARRGFADVPSGMLWWEWATVQLLRRELRRD
jgi:WD40 repeat protein